MGWSVGQLMLTLPSSERLMLSGACPSSDTFASSVSLSSASDVVGRMAKPNCWLVLFTRSASSGPPCPQLLPPRPVMAWSMCSHTPSLAGNSCGWLAMASCCAEKGSAEKLITLSATKMAPCWPSLKATQRLSWWFAMSCGLGKFSNSRATSGWSQMATAWLVFRSG